ncbi:B3 domain-containing transcription factor VRN1-like [Phaseolus vulgaris]
MSNPVILSLPNGSKSKVFWQNKDGGVWFCNGWKEFAKYSKLDVSHFIVFRYEGNSCFNVIIFGKSALEIEYPLSRDATNEEVEEIDEGSDFSLKFSEERSKRPREEAQEEEEESPNKHKKRACSDYSKHKNTGSSRASEHCKGDFKKKLRMFHKKVKEMFKSNHKHFTCIIRKTYTERDLLIMPAEFAKPYLHKEGTATLFVEHGRTWKVQTKVNSHEQFVFSSGWRKFLLDNKLKLGDVCAFEMLVSEPFLFKVTIYPLEDNSNTPLFKGIHYYY